MKKFETLHIFFLTDDDADFADLTLIFFNSSINFKGKISVKSAKSAVNCFLCRVSNEKKCRNYDWYISFDFL
jgi:hypothetical protein